MSDLEEDSQLGAESEEEDCELSDGEVNVYFHIWMLVPLARFMLTGGGVSLVLFYKLHFVLLTRYIVLLC